MRVPRAKCPVRPLLLIVAVLAVVSALGCSSSSGPSGSDDNDPSPGDTVYVDAGYSGEELGTREKPFNSIEEGIAAASKGSMVRLAAGTYSRRDDIDVPKVLTIRGAGSDASIVDARFVVSADRDTQAVTFKRLACDEVTFWGNRGRWDADPWSDRFVWETAARDSINAPIVIDSCAVDTVMVGYPANHSYTIRNSTVEHGVDFGHGYVFEHTTHLVSNCAIGGGVHFRHGGGWVTNTVEDCAIGTAVRLRQGGGSRNVISGNTLYGIYDSSGACTTAITGNLIPSGDIVDRSGGWELEREFIEWNQVMDGIIVLRSGNATCRYNTINAPAETVAINAACGAPANIVGNTITLPYQEVDPESWRGVAIRGVCGEGVINDNVITGGAVGILDRSGATDISGNVISGAHIGIHAETGDGRSFRNNSVSDCVSDGIVLGRYFYDPTGYGAFQGNSVTDNGGAGVRVQQAADLGGGAYGSTGGNVLTGNGDYDLYIEVSADTAAVIYARHNTWDHSTEGEIDALDIYDANDDGLLADVDFMPPRMGGGAW